MGKLKKGDIVGRISYNKDVLFEISNIIKTSQNKEIYILKRNNRKNRSRQFKRGFRESR